MVSTIAEGVKHAYDFAHLSDLITLAVHLFGVPTYTRNGEPIALRTRKIDTLLAYLVLHPGPHTRDKLASLAWPDKLTTEARSTLRVALSMLRSRAGDITEADRDTIHLKPYAVWCDVIEFERMIDSPTPDEATLGAAVALYRGPLLENLYDDWVGQKREALQDLLLDTRRWLAGSSELNVAPAKETLALASRFRAQRETHAVPNTLLCWQPAARCWACRVK